MTDVEIEKALECCCSAPDCESCTIPHSLVCEDILHKETLDYINRLKAEKEQIQKDTAKQIIGQLKGETAIATYTFNPMLASELKTIYLRLEKEYGVDSE